MGYYPQYQANPISAQPTLPPLPQGMRYIRSRRGKLLVWSPTWQQGFVASRVYGGFIRVIQG